MESRYQTLLTLFTIVKNDPQPTTYPCRPREIILRQLLDWSVIRANLEKLEEEELIISKQLDTLVINLTPAGLSKAKELVSESKMA